MVKLPNDDGIWLEGQDGLCSLVFTGLFTPSEAIGVKSDFLNSVGCMVTEAQNADLGREFTEEEFKRAIKPMHPDKAPAPDGFNPAFYQRYWETVGSDIFTEGVNWLNAGQFSSNLNIFHECGVDS